MAGPATSSSQFPRRKLVAWTPDFAVRVSSLPGVIPCHRIPLVNEELLSVVDGLLSDAARPPVIHVS